MLLNFVKGQRINGVDHRKHRENCYALGLLDDEKEWNDCLVEVAQWGIGHELRNIFVTIVIHCQMSNSLKIWENTNEILSEDITSIQRRD